MNHQTIPTYQVGNKGVLPGLDSCTWQLRQWSQKLPCVFHLTHNLCGKLHVNSLLPSSKKERWLPPLFGFPSLIFEKVKFQWQLFRGKCKIRGKKDDINEATPITPIRCIIWILHVMHIKRRNKNNQCIKPFFPSIHTSSSFGGFSDWGAEALWRYPAEFSEVRFLSGGGRGICLIVPFWQL